MLSEAQTMMFFAPNLAILPGCAIVISVLGLNLLGDGMGYPRPENADQGMNSGMLKRNLSLSFKAFGREGPPG